MKHNKLILLAVFPLLLAGCKSNSDVKYLDFDTGLRYTKALTAEEGRVVLSHAGAFFSYASGIVVEANEHEENELSSVDRNTKSTTIFYENCTHTVNEVSTVRMENGVTYAPLTSKTEQSIWALTINNITRSISYSVNDARIIGDIVIGTIDVNGLSGQYLNMFLRAYQSFNFIPYLTDDGYDFVYSLQTKNISYQQVLHDTREIYEITQNQIIVHFDELCRLSWITVVSLEKTNKDPSTGEWYSEIKAVKSVKAKAVIGYETKAVRPTTQLDTILANAVIVWDIVPKFKVANYSDGDYMHSSYFHLTDDIVVNSFNITYSQGTTISFSTSLNNYGTNPNAMLDTIHLEITEINKGKIIVNTITSASLYLSEGSTGLTVGMTSDDKVFFYISNEYPYSRSFTINVSVHAYSASNWSISVS